MEIEIDIEVGYKIMSEIILSDIQLYREELADITLLEFFRMPLNGQKDVADSAEHLAVLELMAPLYCGKDWESKI